MTLPLRIAVADDEPDMRDYFARMLPLMGHCLVVSASNGEELLERCRSARPDLVITDLKMPGMDGIEATARLYRDNPVPVLLVSAYNDSDLVRRAEGAHVMAYLVKPIKRVDLEQAITRALDRYAASHSPGTRSERRLECGSDR